MTNPNLVERRPPVDADVADVDATPSRGRRKLWLALIILIPVLGVCLFLVWQHYSMRESTDDARIDGHITPVSARVGGKVIYAPLEENTLVKAGAVVVRLDPREYEVALRRAEADLASAEASTRAARTNVPITTENTRAQLRVAQAGETEANAGVEFARREVETARAGLRQAEAGMAEARANFERTSRDLERYRQLVERDEISRQQFDAARTQNEAARAAVQTAEAGIARAREGIQAAQTRVAQAEARVAQAQANITAAQTGPRQVQITQAQVGGAEAAIQQRRAAVEQARLNLEYTTITATVDGVLGRRGVELGQNVQPGQPLYSLVDLENLWVTANFKETQLADIRVGQAASISVDAYGGRAFRGRVDSIGAATGATFSMLPAENATGNFVKVVQRLPVRIAFDKGQDPNHQLRPGMSVVPTIFIK